VITFFWGGGTESAWWAAESDGWCRRQKGKKENAATKTMTMVARGTK